MALSTIANNQRGTPTDINQYRDLLTGVMTSQAVTLNYRPGSGTTPTLTLDGDGSGFLIKGLKTDHTTTAFSISSAGAAIFAAGVTATTGTFSGAITSNSKPVYYVDGNGTTAGARIFIGTATPTGAVEGDIWIKA